MTVQHVVLFSFPRPVHQRFKDWLAERHCTPLAFDYHLDERTLLMEEPAA
jgi:hypothetical protein